MTRRRNPAAKRHGPATQRLDRDLIMDRARRSLSSSPRPFLRWAGSKQRLLPHLVPLLPAEFGRYYEPFLGAGALFFLLTPRRASLGDSCSELVDTYKAVRDGPSHVLRFLHGMDPMDSELFYALRGDPSPGRFKRAAEFMFLNRSAWNGLYRVNSKGQFNVPYGAPRTSFIIEPSELHACSKLLRRSGVTLRATDFEETLHHAGRGDLVFLDPPYVTRHNDNGFVDYNRNLFSWKDQERLASAARQLGRLGATVIVTNAHHKDLVTLYRGFDVVQVDRSSTLASDSTRRGIVKEAVFVWQ